MYVKLCQEEEEEEDKNCFLQSPYEISARFEIAFNELNRFGT